MQPNFGIGSSNFSAPGGFNGTSIPAGQGTLAALGLTAGIDSIFGGPEYRFDYRPGPDGDNTNFAPGDRRNQFANFIASGLPASSSNRFRVFRVHPESNNVSGGPVNYEILINGFSTGIVQSINQNLDPGDPIAVQNALDSGSNIGLWELIGEVTITDPSDTITVVQTPTSTSFVSMRSGGVLFEAVPEPNTACLLAVGAMGMAFRRRRTRS